MTDMLSRVKPTVFENDTTFGTNYQGYKLFVPVYHNTISDKSDIGALVFLATETRDNIAICLFSVKGWGGIHGSKMSQFLVCSG